MCAQNVKTADLIAQAKSAAKSGDVEQAEALFRKVLACYPANARACAGLATPQRRAGGVQKLLELWHGGEVSAALKLSQSLPLDHPTVRDVRAAALRKSGQPEAALQIYEAALRSDPRNASHWFNAGLTHKECHRLHNAAHHLSRAVELGRDPDHVRVLAQCMGAQQSRLKPSTHCGEAPCARDVIDATSRRDRVAKKPKVVTLFAPNQPPPALSP